MKGDREKCIEAGASDYVAKPVNMDILLASLRRAINERERASHSEARGTHSIH